MKLLSTVLVEGSDAGRSVCPATLLQSQLIVNFGHFLTFLYQNLLLHKRCVFTRKTTEMLKCLKRLTVCLLNDVLS